MLGAFTVSDNVVAAAVTPLPDAVMVTDAVPAVAAVDALNVTCAELVLPEILVGSNVAVTPDGSPLAAKVTAPVKLVRVSESDALALAPRFTVNDDVLALRPILAAAGGCVPVSLLEEQAVNESRPASASRARIFARGCSCMKRSLGKDGESRTDESDGAAVGRSESPLICVSNCGTIRAISVFSCRRPQP
jgi:hypothetical protein